MRLTSQLPSWETNESWGKPRDCCVGGAILLASFLFGSTLGGSYYCHSNLANEETEARRGSDLAKVPKW